MSHKTHLLHDKSNVFVNCVFALSRGFFSSCGAQASHCGGFSCCVPQALSRARGLQELWLLGSGAQSLYYFLKLRKDVSTV